MGQGILILGESGTGKSTSVRTLDPSNTGIFNVASKRLPFREKFPYTLDEAGYDQIILEISAGNKPVYVIDDSQYLMAFDMFAHAKEKGFEKFTDIAMNFYAVLRAAQKAPENVIVYFLHHSELDPENRTKAKTIGKMLDDKLNVEGMFPIVLQTTLKDGVYSFITNGLEGSPAKSPMGMFEDKLIPNDLRLVDTTVREYWGMPELQTKEPKPNKTIVKEKK